MGPLVSVRRSWPKLLRPSARRRSSTFRPRLSCPSTEATAKNSSGYCLKWPDIMLLPQFSSMKSTQSWVSHECVCTYTLTLMYLHIRLRVLCMFTSQCLPLLTMTSVPVFLPLPFSTSLFLPLSLSLFHILFFLPLCRYTRYCG